MNAEISQPTNARTVSLLFRLWSRFYDNPLPQQLYYRRVHRKIEAVWKPRPGEKVLDVGCGTGQFLKSLSEDYWGLDLTGLDFSKEMLAQAERDAAAVRSDKPQFIHGSVYEMPFETGTFDVALNTISCHFYLEQVKAFREIQRVLKPGGRFFCAAITSGLRGPRGITDVAVYYPPAILSDHFEEAGFKVLGYDRTLLNAAIFRLVKPA